MRRPLPFWTRSEEARSPAVTAEKLVNWYLEVSQETPEYPFALYPTPGLLIRAIAGSGPIRGMHKMGNDLWVVSGNELYSISSTFDVTLQGEIAGAGQVSMATNGTHLLIVTSGQHSYAANADEVVTIPEQDMVSACYQDGYGIAGKRGTEQFYHSNVDDMTTWGGTAFSSADALADKLVAVASMKRRLWCLGAATTEIWYNYGGSPFAFQRESGGFFEIGCVAPHSVAIGEDLLAWLGDEGSVYLTSGGKPESISTPGIAAAIVKAGSPEAAQAFMYKQREHFFYQLTLPDLTLVCDLSTRLWAHRESRGIDRCRAQGHAHIWNKHIVGDYETGHIYELDLTSYTEPETDTTAITAYADGGSGKVQATSTAHGLTSGDKIYISGTTNYDGNYVVSNVAANTFKFVHSWDGDDATGTFQKYIGARRLARSKTLRANGHRVAMDEFLVEIDPGVGTDGSGQGSDPLMMMRYSNNDGRTWSNERTGSMGQIGEYGKQVRWHRLGQYKKRIMEISCSDPVKAVVRAAFTDTEVLGK